MAPSDLERQMDALRRRLAGTGGLLVAFSGGVDSAVVARLALDSLGDRAVAVTVDSQTFTREELRQARRLARRIGIRHIVVKHDELADPDFCRNPPQRCYLCRRGLAGKMKELAGRLGLRSIADGANLSDRSEHRPGIWAATEAGILHPLMEHRVTKAKVREMARALGLPVAGKPSSACLSSRIPYGERITPEKLARIEKAEDYLRRQGFGQVRVRHHGAIARIEVPARELPRLLSKGLAGRVARRLRRLGFAYVTADLQGYRSGSLDEVLKKPFRKL